MLGPKTNLEHILGMFFRDDITSWLFRRVGGAGQIKLAQLKALVAANTETCIARIRSVRSPLRSTSHALQVEACRASHRSRLASLTKTRNRQWYCRSVERGHVASCCLLRQR